MNCIIYGQSICLELEHLPIQRHRTPSPAFSEGLPVGIIIVGRKFHEITFLNVAYAYEKIRDAPNSIVCQTDAFLKHYSVERLNCFLCSTCYEDRQDFLKGSFVYKKILFVV